MNLGVDCLEKGVIPNPKVTIKLNNLNISTIPTFQFPNDKLLERKRKHLVDNYKARMKMYKIGD